MPGGILQQKVEDRGDSFLTDKWAPCERRLNLKSILSRLRTRLISSRNILNTLFRSTSRPAPTQRFAESGMFESSHPDEPVKLDSLKSRLTGFIFCISYVGAHRARRGKPRAFLKRL
jgi:hypothetical protein